MSDRMPTIVFGLQVTIFGGILAFTSTSGGLVLGVAFLGLIISAVGLRRRGG